LWLIDWRKFIIIKLYALPKSLVAIDIRQPRTYEESEGW